MQPDIAGKFDYVWDFRNSNYDKDLVNGISFDPSLSEAGESYDAVHGHVVDSSNDNDLTILSSDLVSGKTFFNATKATIVCVFKPDAINGNNIIFASSGTRYTAGISFWADNLGKNTSNTNCLSVAFVGQIARLETATNSVTTGAWHTAVISFDGDNSAVCVTVNGVSKTSLDNATIPPNLGTDPDRITLFDGVNLNNFDGQVAFLAVATDYAATQAECEAWSRDVYNSFLRPSAPQYFPLGAANDAGGATVSAEITESITLDDTFTGSATGVIAVTITEALSVSDSQTANAISIAAATEAATLTDSQSSTATATASQTESVTLDDALTASSTGQASGVITESVTLADTPTATTIRLADTGETITLDETTAALTGLPASIVESANFSDAITVQHVHAADVAESISLDDVPGSTYSVGVSAAETITLDDGATAPGVYGVDVTEAFNASDLITGVIPTTQGAGITESLSLTDSSITLDLAGVTPVGGDRRQFDHTSRRSDKYSKRPSARFNRR